jgi:hypothetical protein
VLENWELSHPAGNCVWSFTRVLQYYLGGWLGLDIIQLSRSIYRLQDMPMICQGKRDASVVLLLEREIKAGLKTQLAITPEPAPSLSTLT